MSSWDGKAVKCPNCGRTNRAGNVRCWACDYLLQSSEQPGATTEDVLEVTLEDARDETSERSAEALPPVPAHIPGRSQAKATTATGDARPRLALAVGIFVLVTCAGVIACALGGLLALPLMTATVVWVWVDARAIERDTGKRVGRFSAAVWTAGMLLLPLNITLAWYLTARDQHLRKTGTKRSLKPLFLYAAIGAGAGVVASTIVWTWFGAKVRSAVEESSRAIEEAARQETLRVVGQWSGYGAHDTAAFQVTSPWIVRYAAWPIDTQGTGMAASPFVVVVRDAMTGASVHTVVNETVSSRRQGESYVYTTGTFYLSIAGDAWTVEVLSR